MHQAIPYRSWRPLHNTTTHFTPDSLLITHSSHNDNDIENKEESPSFVSSKGGFAIATDQGTMVLNMVSKNAVIVIGRRGCCMSHVMKCLLQGLGVNPAVYEVEENDEADVVRELETVIDGKQGKVQFPAVFIGGKLFGGLDRLMATHLSGELVPLLKEAGALWL